MSIRPPSIRHLAGAAGLLAALATASVSAADLTVREMAERL